MARSVYTYMYTYIIHIYIYFRCLLCRRPSFYFNGVAHEQAMLCLQDKMVLPTQALREPPVQVLLHAARVGSRSRTKMETASNVEEKGHSPSADPHARTAHPGHSHHRTGIHGCCINGGCINGCRSRGCINGGCRASIHGPR